VEVARLLDPLLGQPRSQQVEAGQCGTSAARMCDVCVVCVGDVSN
jgi:hypothetical protein